MSESLPTSSSGSGSDDGLSSQHRFPISDTLKVELEATEEGELAVKFYEDRGEKTQQIYHAHEKRDFFTKRQTRRTIANDVAEKVKTHSEAEAKEKVLDLFKEISAQVDEVDGPFFCHPAVKDVYDATQSVHVYVGEPTTFQVTFDWGDSEEDSQTDIEFTHEEIAGRSAKPLVDRFVQHYQEKLRIPQDAWDDLTDLWLEDAEVVHRETETAMDVIARDVIDRLKERIDVYDDRMALRNDKFAAWYDVGNSSGRSEVPPDQDVVWVRSEAISAALKENGKSETVQSELSSKFRKEEWAFDSSSTISKTVDGDQFQTRAWPLDPDVLGKKPAFVQEYDDSHDGDAGADEDPDDDGGDDGGETATTNDDGDDDGGDAPAGKEVVPDGGRVIADDGKLVTDGGTTTASGGGGASDAQDRAEVVKINGAPGAGKTHTLFDYLETERRENDWNFTDVYFLTFTRAGKREAEDRIVDVFPGDEDDVTSRAKTVHGAALSACLQADAIPKPKESDNPLDLILYDMQEDAYAYRDFCDEHYLTFSEEETDPLKLVREGEDIEATGNKLFSVYQWLKLERKPLEKFPEAPVGLPFDDDECLRLLRAWEEHKEHYYDTPRFEHVDYVDMCIDNGYTPGASVLFIDEFQDLSPQEYLLFKTWRDSGSVDRIYIAGDQNQSLYSFRAGTPWYFRETDVDREEYVTDSYRCPEQIVSVARRALEACSGTDPQGIEARNAGGLVERVSLDTDHALGEHVWETLRGMPDDDPVYLLGRTNYMVGRIAGALNQAGIPYRWFGEAAPWTSKLRLFRDVLLALKHDQNVPREGIQKMFAGNVANWSERQQRLREMNKEGLMGDFYRPETVWEVFDDCQDVYDIAQTADLTDYQRRMVVNAAEADAGHDPGRVRVGTIHASKGSEASTVYLFNAVSNRVHEEYVSGRTQAEEHRVTYVGVTRASEHLVVVDDYFNSQHSLAGLDTALSEVVQ